MEEQEYEEYWDKKKVVGGVFIVILIASFLYYYHPLILGQTMQAFTSQVEKLTLKPTKQVAGVETMRSTPSGPSTPKILPNAQDLQKKIEELTKQVKSLSVSDVASSSPQVQKVLDDLKSLENLPSSKAREACENICRKL